jgi:mediator of RNA polymerase II transcription subunit 10
MFEIFLLSLGVGLGFDVFHFFSQSLVHGLQEVDKLKSQVQEVHVPLEVFE